MKQPDSEHENAELTEALRRDAAQLSEPAFDLALHAAVMRQVRDVKPERSEPVSAWSWKRSWVQAFAAVALLAAVLGYWWLGNHRGPELGVSPEMAQALDSARTSVAGLVVEIPATVPDWMSPTAALLNFSFESANPSPKNP